jgi:hypothetical protein
MIAAKVKEDENWRVLFESLKETHLALASIAPSSPSVNFAGHVMDALGADASPQRVPPKKNYVIYIIAAFFISVLFGGLIALLDRPATAPGQRNWIPSFIANLNAYPGEMSGNVTTILIGMNIVLALIIIDKLLSRPVPA